jgi:hypothetical protein
LRLVTLPFWLRDHVTGSLVAGAKRCHLSNAVLGLGARTGLRLGVRARGGLGVFLRGLAGGVLFPLVNLLKLAWAFFR